MSLSTEFSQSQFIYKAQSKIEPKPMNKNKTTTGNKGHCVIG